MLKCGEYGSGYLPFFSGCTDVSPATKVSQKYGLYSIYSCVLNPLPSLLVVYETEPLGQMLSVAGKEKMVEPADVFVTEISAHFSKMISDICTLLA